MTMTQNPNDTWTSLNDASTARPFWRRPVVLGTAAAVLAGAVAGGVVLNRHQHPGPTAPPSAPASLPSQVDGLKEADTETAKGQQKAFEEKAQKLGDVTVVGRTYTSDNKRRTVKIVMGRTDLTGKLDLAWPADEGRKVGDSRCTSNLKLTPSGKPGVRKTMLVCWRTSKTLSAYSVIIDFDKTPKDSEGVEALMQAWNAA